MVFKESVRSVTNQQALNVNFDYACILDNCRRINQYIILFQARSIAGISFSAFFLIRDEHDAQNGGIRRTNVCARYFRLKSPVDFGVLIGRYIWRIH
jgi:hypothetical protein